MSDSYVKSLNRPRNYGIDILRIISMFMVTVLHFCGFSGIGETTDTGIPFYVGSAFLVVCYGAVNIFGLISGYVMYGSKIKYTRIVGLWFQVVFYSAVLSVAEKWIYDIPINLSIFMPVTFSAFWYFQAYFFMFFFIPLYNEIINKLSDKTLFKFICIGILVFCLFSNFVKMSGKDILGLKSGYGFLWLSFCYIVGAFIQKNKDCFSKISNCTCWLIICINELINYLSYILFFNVTGPASLYIVPKYIFVNYTSVTIFIPAICILIIFSKIKVNRGKKVINFFSSTAFSVYIIQIHSLIWNHYIVPYHTFFKNMNQWTSIPLLLAGVVVLYLAATVVDYLRIQIFRLLHINTLSKLICKLLEKTINVARKPLKKFIQG